MVEGEGGGWHRESRRHAVAAEKGHRRNGNSRSLEYTKAARKHGFNPIMLKAVLILRNKGYNNIEIAKSTGISRNTIAKYLDKLRGIAEAEVIELLSLLIKESRSSKYGGW